jgi:Rps23 Pro-64 3,4-dihydroxylase Tpa1-like proline 4-hydroxylase
LIVYLNSKWKKNWGGELGFWRENDGQPGDLIDKIYPKFNRAVFFDTSQNSWHGLVNPVKSKNNNCRVSFAVYYHINPSQSDNKNKRLKVLYAPDEKQKKNKTILNLIKKRSSIKTFSKVYK